MKRIVLAVLALSLMIPSASFAQGWRRPYYGRPVYRSYGYPGAAIAAGVLGGIATGIILDQVLFPPAVYAPAPAYPPPPPPDPRDPYDAGYSEGYRSGIERGGYDRYQDGRRRGYQEGYDDARGGRGY